MKTLINKLYIILILISTFHITKAQTWPNPTWAIIQPDFVIAAPVTATTCSNNSNAYQAKYGRIAFWQPTATSPIKTIKVNFNIFQKSIGNPSYPNNFQNAPADINRLNQIRDWINDVFLSNQWLYNQAPPNMPFTPPAITDSKIRIETNIYFYPDDALESSNDFNALFNKVISVDPDRANQLNIMFTNGSYLGASGFALLPSFTDMNHDNGVVTFIKWFGGNIVGDFFTASHLTHEIGHCLSLLHTYTSSTSETCNQNDPDYLWDIFGYGSNSLCLFPGTGISNDMMGGNQNNRYTSTLQMGKIHRALALSSVRRYVKCEQLNYPAIMVSTPETWDFDVKLYGDVNVKPGGSITMTCNTQMPTNGKIVVEGSSKLIVDGGKIKGNCNLWKGIELAGYKSYSQLPLSNSPQPIAQIKNGSEIWDMEHGVTTGWVTTTGGIYFKSTGGIIQVDNSSFYNNKKAIQIVNYHNYLPSNPAIKLNNLSYIRNCVFETNYNLKNPFLFPDAFITLKDVENIAVLGNTFRNVVPNATYYNDYERGRGIYGADARYYVDDYGANQSMFHNLWYGVHTDNTNMVQTMRVNHATFDICDRGVYLGNVANPRITNCSFNVPDRWYWNNSALPPTYGSYFNQCPTYTLEANTYTSATANLNNADYGAIANNCGAIANQVYNNIFSGFKFGGVNAQNDNDGPTTSDGLKINCNDFSNNKRYDIFVTGDNTFQQIPLTDVSFVQGYCNGSSVFTEARNQFLTNVCLVGGKQIEMLYTSGQFMLYGYNAPSSPTEPLCFSSLVQKSACTPPFDKVAHCPSTLICNPPCNLSNIQAAADRIAAFVAQFDGGLTNEYVANINSNNLSNEQRDLIKEQSPWISEDVLLALINNAELISVEYTREVLTLNSTLPANVWSYLNLLQTDISNYLVERLIDLQGEPNATDETRMTLASELSDQDIRTTLLTNDYLCLEEFEETGIDNALSLIENKNELNYLCMKLGYYLDKNDWQNATEQLNAIGHISGTERYVSLQQLLTTVEQDEAGQYGLLDNQAALEIISSYTMGTDRAAIIAQAVMTKLTNQRYPETILFPENEGGRMAKDKITEEVSYFKLQPNPTKNSFEIILPIDEKVDERIIQVYDYTGKLLNSILISKEQNQLLVNSTNWQNGIYLVLLKKDGITTQSEKLVVIK